MKLESKDEMADCAGDHFGIGLCPFCKRELHDPQAPADAAWDRALAGATGVAIGLAVALGIMITVALTTL